MSDRKVHRAMAVAGGEVILDDSPASLFPWWSFTKTVLAACALRLVSEGLLTLGEILPGRPFTLRQLLQHRASVPNYGRLDSYHDAVERGDDPWGVDELLERVDAERLDFVPGEGWAYSNVGYLFVRQLIERTTDSEISSAMQRLIFDPLDLRSVRLASNPADLNETAWGNRDGYHPGWVYHGLLVGTEMDAVRVLDGLMSGRLLPKDLLEPMKTPHPLGGPLPGRPWEATGYGLGLMIGSMSTAGLAIGHSGCGPGSVNAVYHFPGCDPPRTAAAFAQGKDEGVTEQAVAQLAAR